jgi:predicted TIM-barrel fold metal-dependent hydrolase
VIFAAFSSDYRAANREVGRRVLAAGGRLFGFAFVHAARDRGRIGELVEEALGWGCRGIKVHRADARLHREICEVAKAHGLPILYDVLGEVSSVELFAGEYPEVDFIIPHLGSFADDYAAQKALIDPLVRLPNVYTDTSGVRRFDLLAEAVERAGPAKVLFGSDGPWLHAGLELAKVRALGMGPPAERLVAGGNLLRLFAKRRRLMARRGGHWPGAAARRGR